MPGFIVHQGAVATCMHAGPAMPTATVGRVRVSGLPVAVTPLPWTVTGCALASTSSPPCVTATWVVGALRVRAMGMRLVINSGTATCVPTGTGLIVISQQPRVRAT